MGLHGLLQEQLYLFSETYFYQKNEGHCLGTAKARQFSVPLPMNVAVTTPYNFFLSLFPSLRIIVLPKSNKYHSSALDY
jgi:hypothetical protein